MKKKWEIIEHDQRDVNNIQRLLSVSRVTAIVMANRGLSSRESVFDFMNSSFNGLRNPGSIMEMDKATKRIAEAIYSGEKILIFGDYDADGITSTIVLYKFLSKSGATVSYYIPHRIKEGYSLQTSHILDLAIPKKISLIITVDCGSSSHEAVEAANEAGIDVIITDHHKMPENSPPALAIVNPKRPDCLSGLDNLAGVGIAFYLVVNLRKKLREDNHWKDGNEPNLKSYCDLVALGTIADIVPISHENRILVKNGLQVMRSKANPGIDALIKACGLDKKFIDSEDVAFRIAPKINAAGRVSHGNLAADLFVEEDSNKAAQIAEKLCQLNNIRQMVEQEIISDVKRLLNDYPALLEHRTLVLSRDGWHVGLLGIAASRIAEEYFKPTVLISKSNGMGKGSARSIPGFNLYKCLSFCSEDLEKFGGHKMAAGLSIKSEKIETFRKNFEQTAIDINSQNHLRPKVMVDCEIDLNDVSPGLLNELNSLQPFGHENEEPLFMAKAMKVLYSAKVGTNHLRLRLEQKTNGRKAVAYNAIWFNADLDEFNPDKMVSSVFRLKWNHYKGRKTPQLVIYDIDQTN